MAGTHITFTVDDAALRTMLKRQAQPETDTTSDRGTLAARIGERLVKTTRERFKTQTAPDGTPWKKLEAATILRKQKAKKNPDKILTLDGYLGGNAAGGGQGPRFQPIDDYTVEVGVNAKYGAIHQFGGEIQKPSRQATVRYRSVAGRVLFAGRKDKKATERQVTIPAHSITMPARPFLGISASDDQEIRQIIQDWVVARGTP